MRFHSLHYCERQSYTDEKRQHGRVTKSLGYFSRVINNFRRYVNRVQSSCNSNL
uniref:Uncharacterized protein n=1 Tax=uncultured Sphingobacterium sp. EB080_L08E11 TaxID=710992 RepID=E0Y0S6_9SPHI|nr:hypothetical protein [uncultured Sphingobacterium sp. EB080_L08E11]